MRAVVLAAGRGQRLLPEGGRSKVLQPLLGLTFLDRVILAAKDAGITEVVVVTGYRAEEVEAYVGDGSRWGVHAVCARNVRWPEGNGTSLLAARPHVAQEPFLLLMGDHIFHEAILLAFVAANPEPHTVAVDPRVGTVPDLAESTKVQLKAGHVVEIGREIAVFNAVDCGIFLLDSSVFPVLEKEAAAGRGTLTDTSVALAGAGSLRTWPIPPMWWFDLDNSESVRLAERAILRGLAKSDDGVVARYLNRPLSIPLSRRVADWRLTPNHWSVISLFVGLMAAVSLGVGLPATFVLGGLLAQFASILDGVDGEVARLRHVASRHGGWLDAVMDRYADMAILLGLAVGGWRLAADLWIWPVLFLAITGAMMVSYTRARFEGAGLGAAPAGGLPVRRDSRIFIVMVGAILQVPLITLGIIAVLGHAEAMRRLWRWRPPLCR